MSALRFDSWWDRCDRAPLRLGLAAIAALQWALEASQLAWQIHDHAHYREGGALAQALARIPGAAWMLWALATIGLVQLARDRRPVFAGAWALTCFAVLSAWQTQVFGSPSRNAFFPGAALLGWVLGQLWVAAPHDDENRGLRERMGEAGAIACIAAAYVGSATSKLWVGGLAWADGAMLRALVIKQAPLASWDWLVAIREAIAGSPSLGRALGLATLVIEGGGWLLLLGRGLRTAWALAIVGLHLSITLLCTMPYLEPMALLGLLALPWPRWLHRRGDDDDRGSAQPLPAVSVLLAMVGLAWLLAPWGWRG